MNVSKLVDSIQRHEGFSPTAYQCPAGVWTIGYGRKVEGDGGITMAEARMMLLNDVTKYSQAAARVFPRFAFLNDARQNVLVEMCFQLGEAGVSKFRRFLDELGAEDWEAAAHEMLQSKWAREDSPARAQELAAIMRSGELP